MNERDCLRPRQVCAPIYDALTQLTVAQTHAKATSSSSGSGSSNKRHCAPEKVCYTFAVAAASVDLSVCQPCALSCFLLLSLTLTHSLALYSLCLTLTFTLSFSRLLPLPSLAVCVAVDASAFWLKVKYKPKQPTQKNGQKQASAEQTPSAAQKPKDLGKCATQQTPHATTPQPPALPLLCLLRLVPRVSLCGTLPTHIFGG